MVNIIKLDSELRAVGIPIDGVADTPSGVRIDFKPEATTPQRNLATDIVAAHDDTLPLGFISALTTGAKLIAIVGASGEAWLPLLYRVLLRTAADVTSPAQISIGTNAPNYNNILAATTLTGWVQGDIQNSFITTKTKVLLAPTPVYVNVITPAQAAQYIIGAEFVGDTKQL